MHESLSQITYNELIKSKAGLVSTHAARAPWTLSGMNLSCYKTLCVFLFSPNPPNRLSSLLLHTMFSYELLSLPSRPPLLSCLPSFSCCSPWTLIPSPLSQPFLSVSLPLTSWLPVTYPRHLLERLIFRTASDKAL